jgi:hypothetical protein
LFFDKQALVPLWEVATDGSRSELFPSAFVRSVALRKEQPVFTVVHAVSRVIRPNPNFKNG